MSLFQNRRIDQKLEETKLRHSISVVRYVTTGLKGSNNEIDVNPILHASMYQV